MKKIIYSILASAVLMFASCSDTIVGDNAAPKGGLFSVVTNLDVTSRASSLESSVEFYLNIDQASDDYFVKMRNVDGTWKAYNVEEPNEEVELTIYGNVNDVVVSALCCDKELTAEEFATTSRYSIDAQKEMFYATNGTNTMGIVSTSESGVISIEFGVFLSRLDIILSGDESQDASVEVSGLSDGIDWCALTNEPFTLSSSESIVVATEGVNSTYSCIVAPQRASTLKIGVTTGSSKSKIYMINDAQFIAGESRDATLNL